MKIALASDLHLNTYPSNIDTQKWIHSWENADVLILAGDICEIADARKGAHASFFKEVAKKYKKVFALCGNHEFYGSKIQDLDAYREFLKSYGITLLEKETVAIDDVRLVATTLWADFPKEQYAIIKENFRDFKAIFNGEEPLSLEDYAQMHSDCVGFLKKELIKPFPGKTVVVTHYPPDPKFAKEGYFAPYLPIEFYERTDYWLYGHYHDYRTQKINHCTYVVAALGCWNGNESFYSYQPKIIVI